MTVSLTIAICYNYNRYTCATPILKELHWLPVETFERKCLAKVKNDGYENHL